MSALVAYTGDPLFAKGLDLVVWIILLVKLIAVFALLMLSVLFMIMYERKAIARLGTRWGPNRAGPLGWLQSLADGLKLFFKEALLPATADKIVYRLAPVIAVVPAFVAFSIVPVGGTITITNIGVFGIDTGTPILNPGESAILALGAIRDMPWVVDGAVVPRKVCQLALSIDHRVVDGQQGSQFLTDIAALLTDPALAITY